MKYFGVCMFLLAGNEIVSLLALLLMMGMFLWDIARARIGKEETWKT